MVLKLMNLRGVTMKKREIAWKEQDPDGMEEVNSDLVDADNKRIKESEDMLELDEQSALW